MFSMREKLERRKLGGLWYYSLSFTGLILVVLAIFYYFNRSLIWSPDGEDIYFVIMRYSRDYLLNLGSSLLKTGKLVLPQWDFSIGQGNNVLVGFHFNPFFLFALLCPTQYLEYAYGLIALLQLYCTGAAFCLFCRRAGQTDPFSVSLGAIVYTFSGFAFHASYSHIYFVANLMLCLTLILVAAERYLQDGKWGLFVAVITLTMLGGYYYAYMDTLLMTVYLVIRQLCVNGRDLKKSFFQLMRLFLYYLLGFALSLFNFLPAVMNYFICGRSGIQTEGLSLFYSWNTYSDMVASLFSPQFTGNWHQLSFLGIALVALTLVFLRRERETLVVRVSFLVCTAFFLLPLAGKVFNGMGYVTNRWCFGYALCISMVTVYGARDLWKITDRERKAIAAAAAVWMVLSLCITRRYEVLTGVVLMGLTLLAVLPRDKSRYHDAAQRRVAWVTALAAVVHIGIFFLPPFQNEMSRYKEGNRTYTSMLKSAEFAARKIEDDSFYRLEVPATRTNRFALSGENGTSSYWSALPAKMTDYYLNFALSSVRLSYAIWGMDRSTVLTTLSGVKYNLANDSAPLPYGYEPAGEVTSRGRTYQVSRNRFALPLGYTYDKAITSDAFAALNPIQRQQAVLQRAVMDTVPEGLSVQQPELTVQELPIEKTHMKAMSQHEDGNYYTKANGVLTLSFTALPNSETWLYLEGITASNRSDITVTCRDVTRGSILYQQGADHYFPREGIAYNLGCGLKGKCNVHIQFSRSAAYHFTPVLCALPMEDYERDVTALGAEVLEEIKVGTNQVTGRISVTEPRLLVLTIPHIGGWSATVDGQSQPLLDVNTYYMGLMLEPGEHTIRLRYEMPGFRIGTAVSAAAAAGLAVYGLAVSVRRRKRKISKQTEVQL